MSYREDTRDFSAIYGGAKSPEYIKGNDRQHDSECDEDCEDNDEQE
jgi:hypothetical protein